MPRMSRFVYKFPERIQISKEEILVRIGELEVDISLSNKEICKPINLNVNYNI